MLRHVWLLVLLVVPGVVGRASAHSVDRAGTSPTWIYGADYPIAILDQATVVLNGVLYSFAGVSNGAATDAAYKYDGSTWTEIARVPVALEVPVAVSDGTSIFILGGISGAGATSNAMYKYVPATNTYTTMAPFNVSAWAHSAVVANGRIVKFGGQTIGATLDATEIYDIASNSWLAAAAYPEALSFIAAFEYGGYVYGAGGLGNDPESSLKTYRYDFSTNTWDDAPIPDLPETRWGGSVIRSGNGAVVSGGYVGGSEAEHLSASAVFWDGSANVWRGFPAMLADRARMAGGLLNGRLTVVGGRSSATPGFSGTVEVQVHDGLFANGFDRAQ